MQKSIWLLAFVPYLHWFGSVVDGATVLTSPASPIRILQPQNLNSSNGLPDGLSVVVKERGDELLAVDVFQTGLVIIDVYLAPEDFYGFIPPQAWSFAGMVLGVSVDERWRRGTTVQRAFVIEGIYFILLLMKNQHDFRSGVFEIQYLGIPVCDISIFATGSSGLETLPSFAHVTPLDPPPSPTAYNTNSSSQLVASPLGIPLGLFVFIGRIEPFQPLDQLDQLLSLVDMLVTVAQPPEDERAQSFTENTPSGVKISISPAINASTPIVMTYEMLIFAAYSTYWAIANSSEWRAALRIELYFLSPEPDGYVGEITMVPSNSSAPTSLLTEANVNASTSTATARKKRLIA